MAIRPLPALAVAAALAPAALHAQQAPRSVTPEALAKYWQLIGSSLEASVPLGGRGLDVPGCATVSFVVEKDGSTSQIKVQRVVPAGDLGRIAQSMASHMRFEPTVTNSGRGRVFSWLIFPFNSPADAAARSAMMQPCAIKDLGWKDR